MPRPRIDKQANIETKFLPDCEGSKTLEEAQEDIYERIEDEKDAVCECCGQTVRLYKRRPTAKFLTALVDVAVKYQETHDWIDLTDVIDGSVGEFLLWEHWGFIEVSDVREEEKHKYAKSPRLVKPTQAAIDWLLGKTAVSAYLWIYNGEVVEPVDRTFSFNDVTKNKFISEKRKINKFLRGEEEEPKEQEKPKQKIKLKRKMKLKIKEG